MLYKNRLEQIRDRQGITKTAIAKMLGIDVTSYAHYEKEDDIIPLKHLIAVCDYFNVSIDYIFEFTDRKQYSKSIKGVDKTVVGIRLKKFRKEFKLTQAKLASILNTVHTVIYDYERGRYLIATPFLYTICKKYGVSADWLLGKVGEDDKIYYIKKDVNN